MLPGGANGGAKPFIFDLLQRLAARQPQVRFTAVCQSDAAHELRAIETDNLKLHVQETAILDGGLDRKRWLGSRRLAKLKRRLVGGADRKIPQAQLLFCPFGVPLIQRPALAIVCTFYDLQVEAYPNFFPPEVQRERLGHFRRMVSCATRIAAISEFSRELAITKGVEQQLIRAIAIQITPRPVSVPGDSSDAARSNSPRRSPLIDRQKMIFHREREHCERGRIDLATLPFLAAYAVPPAFARLDRDQQIRHLLARCSSV
jgi:hypothetical protein